MNKTNKRTRGNDDEKITKRPSKAMRSPLRRTATHIAETTYELTTDITQGTTTDKLADSQAEGSEHKENKRQTPLTPINEHLHEHPTHMETLDQQVSSVEEQADGEGPQLQDEKVLEDEAFDEYDYPQQQNPTENDNASISEQIAENIPQQDEEPIPDEKDDYPLQISALHEDIDFEECEYEEDVDLADEMKEDKLVAIDLTQVDWKVERLREKWNISSPHSKG
eukprot:CAMPEP_0167759276 /NCGR_PEP_ID=MMETSP0110_2-20121227/10930_1 /TAXON_ID=629695 /ORGANISM="Gymnochlora sp., Strain CCMP2014" /LENGTH=223 /DNA_ID=CAMNT_0007645637 /DNA_START=99 /DNA_END=770 /DNA_ORIENTATION=+